MHGRDHGSFGVVMGFGMSSDLEKERGKRLGAKIAVQTKGLRKINKTCVGCIADFLSQKKEVTQAVRTLKATVPDFADCWNEGTLSMGQIARQVGNERKRLGRAEAAAAVTACALLAPSLTREVWLDGNAITGPLPAYLWGLSNLTQLIMNQNEMSGPIPAAMGTLTNLTHVHLHKKQLEGDIPEAIGKLPKLKELNLQNNALEGVLHVSIIKMIGRGVDVRVSDNVGFVFPRNLEAELRSLVELDLKGYCLPSPSMPPLLHPRPFFSARARSRTPIKNTPFPI